MNKIFPRHVLRIALLLLVLTWANSGAAQAVYESQSGSGKVYSDRPISGGKPVELAPLNVVEPVAEPAAAQRSAGSHSKAKAPKTEAEPIYLHFAVTFPEQGGSVATNSAIFDV